MDDVLNVPFVKEIRLQPPEQRIINGRVMPLVLQCTENTPLSTVSQWIEKNTTALEKLISKHGGILFRGFPLNSAETFDAFVKSFVGWKDLSYSESLSIAVRTHITGRVCTTNDGKNGGLMYHHEMAQTPLWPSKIIFYCQTPATQGGATAITPSTVVFTELQKKFPEFVDKCQKHGVRYTLYLGPDQDISKGAGRSWKSLWAETKEEAEAKMKKFGYTWEWLPGEEGLLKCTTPILKAVLVAPGTDEHVFFNQLIASQANAKEWSQRATQTAQTTSQSVDLSRFLSFGDGSVLESPPLEYAFKVADENAIELKWQKGDVGVLDNYLVMHARRQFEGPRHVYASLVL